MKIFFTLTLLCDGLVLLLIIFNILFGFDLSIGYIIGLIVFAFIFSVINVLSRQESKNKVAIFCIASGLIVCYGIPILSRVIL